MIGYAESAEAIGMTLGPVIGSALYEFGGYSFPFLVYGAVFILINPVIYCLMPSLDDITEA